MSAARTTSDCPARVTRQPWPVADIGGTNARIALADPKTGTLSNLTRMSTGTMASLTEPLTRFLSNLPSHQSPSAGCVAFAGPVLGDWCQMTNARLSFSIEQTRRELDLDELHVVNDLAPTARCLPQLSRAEYQVIGDAEIREDALRVAVGPGTGLGFAAVTPVGNGWKVIAGEGGHVALSGTVALFDATAAGRPLLASRPPLRCSRQAR